MAYQSPPNNEPDLFSEAFTLHQSGKLKAAQRLYEQMLKVNPDRHDVLHLLGVSLYQQGRSDIAVPLLEKSVAIEPTAVAYGHLALALKALSAIEKAELAFRQALKLAPEDASIWNNLGNFQREREQFSEALATLQQAVALNSELAEAWVNLALTQQGLNQLEQALQSWSRAVAINPDWPLALSHRAALLFQLGRFQECIEAYAQWIRVQPNNLDPRYQRALVLQKLGQSAAAITSYKEILSIDPAHHSSLNNLGNLLTQAGDFLAAEHCLRTLIELAPNDAHAYGNLGVALKAQRRFIEAIAVYRTALKLKPDYTHALNNLGTILKDLGSFHEAIDCFDRALEQDPNYLDAHSNRLFTLSLMPRQDPVKYLRRASEYGATIKHNIGSFDRHSTRIGHSRSGPLRVGFVSGDLKSHPVGYFLENFIKHLDRTRITTVAYTTNSHEDALSLRLRNQFEEWHTLVGLSDEQAAKQVNDHAIDVLFDLAGHTAHHRLPLFARKPAPVQVTWLGYFASTGVPGIDYLLADDYSVSQQHEQHFTEAIWRLPETRLCFTPPSASAQILVSELPALRRGHLTFASYQNLAKINSDTITVWSKVLKHFPNSRMRIQNTQLSDPNVAENFRQNLGQHDIEESRVELLGACARDAYLQSYAEVDIVLDTFPFPGGTTTCEALWMGVPTITLVGDTLLSRQGGSLLRAAGYEDWIATNTTEYFAKVIHFASDLEQLSAIRQGMRPQVIASPLCDSQRFARCFESAVQDMWAACASGS